MKSRPLKLTFDLSDKPELVELLRAYSTKQRESQKDVIVKALEAFFADKLESKMLLKAAERSFAEWDNPEDEIYNDL